MTNFDSCEKGIRYLNNIFHVSLQQEEAHDHLIKMCPRYIVVSMLAEGKKDDVVSMLSSAFTSKMEILRNFEEKKHFEGYHFCVVDKLLRL
jgi:uracil DNA glycosylase